MSKYYRTILQFKKRDSVEESLDPDAQAFLTAAGIVDATITSAINNLVLGLKGASLWAKMKAIYPFVGGTADSHKYNLKDPRDLDAAYRITWFGGVTHSANGVQGNGTNGYGDTHLNSLTEYTDLSDAHFALYLQNDATVTEVPFGWRSDTPNLQRFTFVRTTTINALAVYNVSEIVRTATKGFNCVSRINSTELNIIDTNGNVTVSSTLNNSNRNITSFILARSLNGAPNFYSPSKISFASQGLGLTTLDLDNYKTIIDIFQTALSRNV